MPKLECALYGDFDAILQEIDDVLDKNISLTLEESSDFETKHCRCAVRVYERYSFLSGGRVSLNITLLQADNKLFFSGVTSGGSEAIFFKLDTIGEKTFLKKLFNIVKKYMVIKEVKDGNRTIQIRNAVMDDLDVLEKIEATCFPEAEAATRMTIFLRLRAYADHFWIIEVDGKAVGFIDGAVTNEKAITDIMFEDVALHKPDGDYQAVFGLNVLPDYRRNGYGSLLMQALIDDAKAAGRKGCILTCKEQLIPYYEKFGYVNQGVSKSEHGGAVWYDMLLEF